MWEARRLRNGRVRDAPATWLMLNNGCGSRIRTGDTRRMKPLPCHLATPLLLGEMERSAGLAPAFPDWKSEILLLDDDRIVKIENKHRYQSVDGLVPAG